MRTTILLATTTAATDPDLPAVRAAIGSMTDHTRIATTLIAWEVTATTPAPPATHAADVVILTPAAAAAWNPALPDGMPAYIVGTRDGYDVIRGIVHTSPRVWVEVPTAGDLLDRLIRACAGASLCRRYTALTDERKRLHAALYSGEMDADDVDAARDELAADAWALLDCLAPLVGATPNPLRH